MEYLLYKYQNTLTIKDNIFPITPGGIIIGKYILFKPSPRKNKKR